MAEYFLAIVQRNESMKEDNLKKKMGKELSPSAEEREMRAKNFEIMVQKAQRGVGPALYTMAKDLYVHTREKMEMDAMQD